MAFPHRRNELQRVKIRESLGQKNVLEEGLTLGWQRGPRVNAPSGLGSPQRFYEILAALTRSDAQVWRKMQNGERRWKGEQKVFPKERPLTGPQWVPSCVRTCHPRPFNSLSWWSQGHFLQAGFTQSQSTEAGESGQAVNCSVGLTPCKYEIQLSRLLADSAWLPRCSSC